MSNSGLKPQQTMPMPVNYQPGKQPSNLPTNLSNPGFSNIPHTQYRRN